jgi:hypothetical protein
MYVHTNRSRFYFPLIQEVSKFFSSSHTVSSNQLYVVLRHFIFLQTVELFERAHASRAELSISNIDVTRGDSILKARLSMYNISPTVG